MLRSELTRRALVAGAAAVAATATSAAVAAQAEPDPIFALIEAHKVAFQEFENWPGFRVFDKSPEDEAEERRLSDADWDAACALGDCIPTSMAGVIALLDYVADLNSTYDQMDYSGKMRPQSYWVLHNCALALEDMAGVAAVSALPTAAPAGVNTNNADAKLIALGVDLERIIREWLALKQFDRMASAEHEAACERAGLPFIGIEALEDGTMTREQFDEHHGKRQAIRTKYDDREEAQCDEHGCSIAWSEIHDRLLPLCGRILACRAHTVAGLAVQARAISLSVPELWDDEEEEEDDNSDECHHRRFIEAVCSFTGVVPVASEEAARKAVRP
jgi:hypothetical protein